ncbi:amidohydrolase family protein [Engelhardtia mirabilis]|uniref:Imidazolonepropionase n=1 Tax=Engelhardtia mirabilis TaxID=2528011 RepID=A0A518BDK6_9BACT|nr:imidazolonepropionase [Planctomycetes bacterium Pla133]QDU99381.1 imidazolonepropionase [Planctomycetes bacterium Pla86]
MRTASLIHAGLAALVAGGALSSPAAASSVPLADPSSDNVALRAAKILTCAEGDLPAVINDGLVLVENGVIVAIGPADSIEVPEGVELIDVGDHWLMPGMIDLHCHVAGRSLFEINDLNDGVYLTNPGLRASAAVVPLVDTLELGLAGGVTSVLYIPGSATNIGGQGVLLKTGFDTFGEMLIRNPGSMKLAQAGNPERYTWGVGRSFMNWNTRDTIERGMGRARARAAGATVETIEKADPQFEVFDHLLRKEIRVSAHTQVYQVVLMTVTMVQMELGVDVFIDHGTIGAWQVAPIAAAAGVPAIVGPRAIDTPRFQSVLPADAIGIRSVAAGYQALGHPEVGFNTDSPVVPQEELSIQATMGARYGFKDDALQTIRGLTIVPARAARIADRVGSLEVGKDADILVITGHPIDPRTAVDSVWIEGRLVYDAERDGRRW